MTWLGFATRLQNTITLKMPITSEASTCQLAMPRENRAPAVT